jgi:hypothetical protein
MILDKQLQFSDAQDVSSSTSGKLATNVIDLKGTGINLGAGRPLYVVAIVTTALTGAGDTLDIDFVSDSVSSLDSSLSVHGVLGTFAAQSAAGTKLVAPIPTQTLERYVGLRYYARGAGDVTGNVSAFLTLDPDLFTAYADAITIS